MILPIVAYGSTVLRKETEFIDNDYPNLSSIIADMYETMYHAKGVGLAAPQIGLSISLFVIDSEKMDEEEANVKQARTETMSAMYGRPSFPQ